MRYFLTFALSSLLSITCFAVKFDHKEYSALLDKLNRGEEVDLSLPELSRYHVVFVGGYMNELANGYFRGPEKAIRTFGDGTVTTLLMPFSKNAVVDNIPLLHEALQEAFVAGGGKPLLIIGHSKGGVESLATTLAHPEMIGQGMVASVTTVQSPLTGCYLAKCSSELLSWTRVVPSLDGGHSLHPEELDLVIRDAIRNLPKAVRADVSDRVHYVISKQQAAKVALALQLSTRIISAGTGEENDGLVSKTHMWVRQFGKVIASIEADHMELLVELTLRGLLKGLNTPHPNKNRAFTYLLLKSLLAEISTLEKKPKSCQTVLY